MLRDRNRYKYKMQNELAFSDRNLSISSLAWWEKLLMV